jgi:hypothetical protein
VILLLVVALGIPAIVVASPGSDRDGDGVTDSRDACQTRLPGASGVDRCGCPTEFDYLTGVAFDNSEHRLWYLRFWTGECDGSLTFCSDGAAGATSMSNVYWTDLVERMTARMPGCRNGELRVKLWRLGRDLGSEWARDNSTRRVDTDDLMRWGKRLLESRRSTRTALVDSLARIVQGRLKQ